MGDKSSDRGPKMFVARIDDPIWLGQEAKRMSKELVHKEFRGPGDTIEAAAYRLQAKHKVDASIILQGWQREPREWKVSRWMSLFQAHCHAFAEKAEQAYEGKRETYEKTHQGHPVLLRLADFVAGRQAEREEG